MKQFISGMLVALVALAVYACTTPSGGGASAGAKNPVLFKVNGQSVTAEEFFSNPAAKNAINQIVMLEAVKDEARKAGATVDEKQFADETDQFKKNVEMSGMKWDDWLKQQGMTEKEFLDQRRTYAQFQALLKKKANVTEADMRKAWTDDKDAIINEYAVKNHLPDSEKSKLTYDKVKDAIHERVEQNKMGVTQGQVFSDIMMNAKLEITCLDPAKSTEIADKILGPAKEQAKKQQEAAADAEKKKAEAATAPPVTAHPVGQQGAAGGTAAPPAKSGQTPPPAKGGQTPPAGKPGGK